MNSRGTKYKIKYLQTMENNIIYQSGSQIHGEHSGIKTLKILIKFLKDFFEGFLYGFNFLEDYFSKIFIFSQYSDHSIAKNENK
ncbi:hypothetical protein BpHYR1_021482 [Brachionus plicatilis]|uniref:Uncharacterized protein n=1 Tax=Brachionus plicatilis TaxID=10195 RepID=A0A3M7PTS0_BRAPC|nr:hypothetical protein BpHYR1_021482 [Brachionus plicatilis]